MRYNPDPGERIGLLPGVFPSPKTTDFQKDLSQDNPLQWQRYYSPAVLNDIVGPALGRSGVFSGPQDENYFYKQDMQGVDQSLGKDIGASTNNGYQNSGDPMSAAIAKKYQSDFSDKLRGIQGQQKINSISQQNQEAGRAGNMLGTMDKLALDNFREQYAYQEKRRQLFTQWQQAKDAATAGYIGQVIGGVGAGVAMVAAA